MIDHCKLWEIPKYSCLLSSKISRFGVWTQVVSDCWSIGNLLEISANHWLCMSKTPNPLFSKGQKLFVLIMGLPSSSSLWIYLDFDYVKILLQIAVFTRNDFKAAVDNGETLEPHSSELKLMSEYRPTDPEPFAAEVVHQWTVPQKPPDLRSVVCVLWPWSCSWPVKFLPYLVGKIWMFLAWRTNQRSPDCLFWPKVSAGRVFWPKNTILVALGFWPNANKEMTNREIWQVSVTLQGLKVIFHKRISYFRI